jgi:ATP-dependent Clp protease ATP-binding subunit ClpC
MDKDQLLTLLGPSARQSFDKAKELARAWGGVLSPLHLIVAIIGASAATDDPDSARGRLCAISKVAIESRYNGPSDSIKIPKETQDVISRAGALAGADGSPAGVSHLLRASLESTSATEAIAGALDFAKGVDDLVRRPAQERVACPDHSRSKVRPLAGVLADYCSDLAEESRSAASHPFVGRQREITAVLETLCRKLKNNPLLIGKPGVGKTALVIAVASRLCEGDVPTRLRGKRILEVSRLRLLADAKFSGDIEERLKQLLSEVRHGGDVILFFDEIHTLLSAGGAGGTGDVANLLKSSLSKGEITCIGATTLAEYYKYIARDEALARRFSTITIEEPSPEETRTILLETRSSFEAYHEVVIDDETIGTIVEMAERYLHSRCFPDKAFDLLDKAAAKATLAGHTKLKREVVTETLSEMTGLPLELMSEDPSERLNRLESVLNAAVPGQARASRDVARVARIAKLGLEIRPEKPDGVFLFVGPEGVGKHEMATALAKFLYGSPQKMIEFDMSQFTEVWSISRLIGAEPGYVGYSERSGLLSKAAEDNPHSLLYFRNIDLANQVVQQFLGEAFEQGQFTDATGSRVSLSNMTVVMSLSKLGENHKPVHVGFFPGESTDEKNLTGALRITGSLSLRERGTGFGLIEALASTVDEVIEFQVLDRDATEKIIAERLEALKARLASTQAVTIKLDPELAGFLANQLARERKSLAQLERLLQETIIIPFTNLRIDQHGSGRREVAVNIEQGLISVSAC